MLYYDKKDSSNFSFKFPLAKHIFEIIQLDEDIYNLKIDGVSYNSLMSEERNGRLDKASKERAVRENKQREIDEYNRRDIEYNRSNYYKGMENKNNNSNNNVNKNLEDEIFGLFNNNNFNNSKNNKNQNNNNNNNMSNNFYNNNMNIIIKTIKMIII